jgi:hypothetical protein
MFLRIAPKLPLGWCHEVVSTTLALRCTVPYSSSLYPPEAGLATTELDLEPHDLHMSLIHILRIENGPQCRLCIPPTRYYHRTVVSGFCAY